MEINFALHVQLYDAILTNQKRRNWSATAGLFRDAGGRVDPESTQEGGGAGSWVCQYDATFYRGHTKKWEEMLRDNAIVHSHQRWVSEVQLK